MRFTGKICFILLVIAASALTAFSQLRIVNGLVVNDSCSVQSQVVDLTQDTYDSVSTTRYVAPRKTTVAQTVYRDAPTSYVPRPTYYTNYGYSSYSSWPTYSYQIPIPGLMYGSNTYSYNRQYSGYSNNYNNGQYPWQSSSTFRRKEHKHRDRDRYWRSKHRYWQY